MTRDATGGDPPPNEGADSTEVELPTWAARIRIEKKDADLNVEADVPPNQLPGLFDASIYGIAMVGAIVGPPATLAAMPSSSPAWLTAAVVLGELAVLLAGVVAVWSARKRKRGGKS